ncbi:MAG: Gfo/Idh/MocA family oxidoreductase [Armatimonadetes bacterium]|nr:Gfo/Idh/MocA family oxidoreductase [Armatimonadota bacterium]
MDKLRIGVIGVGGRGGLARNWHHPEDGGRSVLVAGADVNEGFLAKFAEDIEGAFVTTDCRRMLERPDIDAVAVTSPDFMHEEHAVAALEAGKHVFCEKPLAITIAGADRMLRTAKQCGRKLMAGHNMRYMHAYRVMKEIVQSGAIGQIKTVWMRHFVGLGGHFYYHDWHATRRGANTLLLQKGSHDIDMIHWICDAYAERVVAMGALSWYGGDKPNDLICPECDIQDTCPDRQSPWPGHEKCAFRQEVDVEDNSLVMMQIAGGIQAAYLQCHFSPEYDRNYCFIGTEGRMELVDGEARVLVKTRRGVEWKQLADREYRVKPADGGHGGADPQITRDFLAYVLDDEEPIATALAGRMAVAVGCLAADSMRNGSQPYDVPAVEV